jgi:hypothetical protein
MAERALTGAFRIVDLEGRCLQRLRPTGQKGSTAVRRQPREGAASSSPPSLGAEGGFLGKVFPQ